MESAEGRAEEPDRSKGGNHLVDRTLIGTALAFILAAGVFSLFSPAPRYGWHLNLLLTQDLHPGFALAFALAATVFIIRSGALARHVPRAPGHLPVALSFAVFALTGGCAIWLLGGFAFSHDEFLLVEEARLFVSGRVAAPVPAEWRPFIEALQPYYVRVNTDMTLLSTGYLPGSAALYALFEAFGAGALTNPTLAAGSVLLTAHVARRIFPDAPEMAFVAALLLATSPQFLVTAMTPYAMTAHLFLNLAWMALFLRGSRTSHIGALLVGAFAIAQHQIHIHPLFALPFLVDLAFRRRQWRLALVYLVVYAAVLAGCLAWRGFVLDGPAVNMMAGTIETDGLSALITRVTTRIIEIRSPTEPLLWLGNLLRFAGWQNPVTLILAAIGLLTVRRAPRLLQLLAIGVALTLLPNILIVNSQGVGWGFRYLHVGLAATSLLSVWGVIELRRRARDLWEWQRASAGLLVLGVIAAPVLIVWRIADIGAVVLPYRAAEAEISRMDADVLVTTDVALVRNDFQFRNAPKILALDKLSGEQFVMLCDAYKVAVVPPGFMTALGAGRLYHAMDPEYIEAGYRFALAQLKKAGCP
jgi:hypothetical protein